MKQNLIVVGVVAVLMAGFVLAYQAITPTEAQPTMGGMDAGGMTAGDASVPPVKGYLNGQEIRFIHTEASDPKVADLLTMMMNSPVVTVPALGQVPDSALAPVYVFTNGVKGDGPFGFQPDVFDTAPGTAGYSPMRKLNLVTWKQESQARLLKSAADVEKAQANGELTIERPGAVVNMPILTWPGGHR
jgi:hypothetical protein